MSVSPSFIEGLLATSGDSNARGSGDSDSVADSGAGAQASDAGGKQDVGEQRRDPGSTADPSTGAKQATESESSAEAGKQPDAKPGDQPAVAEAPKGPDQPAAQIANLNGALREVRGENKELKQALAKQQEQFAALQKQIEALSNPPKAGEVEEEPDFLADPKVYVDKNLAKAKAEATRAQEAVKKLEDGETARAEQAKKQAEMQEQWNEVITKETEFATTTPDYQDAINYVRNLRVQAFTAEYEAINDRAPTQAEISKALTTQEIQGALTLQQKGKNPAQWYYNYAKSLGYKTPEPQADPAATPAAAVAQPPAKSPPKPDKDAVRSMGSGGGAGTPPDPEAANRDPMDALLGMVHGEMTAKRKARRS